MRFLRLAPLALLIGAPAHAAVTYRFTAESNLGFSWTTPDFVHGRVDVPIGALDSCSAPPGSVCYALEFNSDVPFGFGSGFDFVYFTFVDPSVVYPHFLFALTRIGTFARGAFLRPGTYHEMSIGLATLVVSTDTAAVPEPASWALLIAGFGVTGAALRRRRAAIAAAG